MVKVPGQRQANSRSPHAQKEKAAIQQEKEWWRLLQSARKVELFVATQSIHKSCPEFHCYAVVDRTGPFQG